MPTSDSVAREREISRPGGEGNAFPSWSLGQYEREIVRAKRVSWSWSSDDWIPRKYEEGLAGIGITDPTEAIALWKRGHELVSAAQNVVAEDVRDQVGDQLARGELAASDVHKALAKKPTREDSLRRAKDEQAALRLGARRAGIAGARMVHDFAGWASIMREVIARALSAQDDGLWDRAHSFGKLLRDQRARLCGLSALCDRSRIDAELMLYQFKRPDLVQRWRIARAGPGELREVTRFRDAERSLWISVVRLKSTVPFPKIADFSADWSPGFYLAEEIGTHLAEIRAAESLELDELASPATRKPAPRQAVSA